MSVPVKQESVMKETYVTQNPSRQASFSSTGGEDEYSTETVATAATSDIDMVSSLVDQHIWTANMQQESTHHQVIHPLDSTLMLDSWDPTSFANDLKTQDWELTFSQHTQQQEQQKQQHQQNNATNYVETIPKANEENYTLTNMMPHTPPVHHCNSNNHTNNNNYANANMLAMNSFRFNNNTMFGGNDTIRSAPPSVASSGLSTPTNSGMVTPPMTNYFNSRSSLPTQLNHNNSSKKITYMNNTALDINNNRRSSSADTRLSTPNNNHHQRYGRRASSNPSVASVVSLTAHEPVSKIIDGIEYITFLYSHDRLVKEYTVRTDVDHVNMDDIAMDFRIQNAIYPRANVDRSEYDGNRWDYETTCNQLGWKLCWLNKEQLFGRRGLIQRAVDSYRNRHAEMRSRRVTRQEKVANGTLRKRRSKKSLSLQHNVL